MKQEESIENQNKSCFFEKINQTNQEKGKREHMNN